MTSIGRFKRSCLCSVVAVITSAFGVLVIGLLENQPTPLSFGVSGLLLGLLGLPLAPGWFLGRGIFERVNLFSLSQIAGPAFLILLLSVVIDASLIFGVWELIHRKKARVSDSDNGLHTN